MSMQIPLNLYTRPDYSVCAFVDGQSNREALCALADARIWANHSLALIGPKGSGKTHLGHIWAKQNEAISLKGANGFVPRWNYRGRAIWIDDAAREDEYSLFTLINLTITGEIPALLLGDQSLPSAWHVQLPDLRSRLRNLQVAKLHEPDDAVLRAIMVKLFKERSRTVADNLLDYLLIHADRSVDGLRQLIAELDSHAASEKANLTRTFAAKYMQGRLFE